MKEIPKHILEDISISSTNIREAILHSDITTADKLLGYDFFFSGIVVHGNKLGRTLGYPTANLKIADEEKLFRGMGFMLCMHNYKGIAKTESHDEHRLSSYG